MALTPTKGPGRGNGCKTNLQDKARSDSRPGCIVAPHKQVTQRAISTLAVLAVCRKSLSFPYRCDPCFHSSNTFTSKITVSMITSVAPTVHNDTSQSSAGNIRPRRPTPDPVPENDEHKQTGLHVPAPVYCFPRLASKLGTPWLPSTCPLPLCATSGPTLPN